MTSTAGRNFSQFLRRIWDEAGMAFICVAFFALCAAFVKDFASWRNMDGLATSITTVGLLSCTMLFCLASGHFDLSIGSVVACSGVVTAVVINHTHSLSLGVASGLLLGGLVGLANGLIIAKLKINALITTLATMQIVHGIALIIPDGKSVAIMNDDFAWIGTGRLFGFQGLSKGISIPVFLMIVSFAIFGWIIRRTIFGRNTLALGGNEEAVRLAGIHVDRLKISIFTLQGAMAGFAGILTAANLQSGQPNTAEGLELEVISACVLGGVSLSGGIGSLSAVISGVLIMGAVQNAMSLCNVDSFWQYVARGSILLAAVLFDRLKQKR